MRVIFAHYNPREASKVFDLDVKSKTVIDDTTKYRATYKGNDGIISTELYFTGDACGYISFTGSFIPAKNWMVLDDNIKL